MNRSAILAAVSPALLLALAGPARAVEVKPVARIGFDFGGDNLITRPFVDGSSRSIGANEGFWIGAGVLVGGWASVEAELTLSYKFASARAASGDVTWTRTPLDALAFYRLRRVRLGGGVTYHFVPQLQGAGVASNATAKFDDALGWVLQADYILTPRYVIGARYTDVTYRSGGASFGGKGLGTTIGFVF